MANIITHHLPCDADGVCMVCKQKPSETETLHCKTCTTPWHAPCLPVVPTTSEMLDWLCPDCAQPSDVVAASAAPSVAGDLVSAIRAIENDPSLTEEEKRKKRQELHGGSLKEKDEVHVRRSGVLDIFDGSLNCSFCVKLPERPVTVSFFFIIFFYFYRFSN